VCVQVCVCVRERVIDGLKTIALCAMPWRPSHKHTASAQQCIWASDYPPFLFPRTLANPPFLCHHLLFLCSKLNYRSPLQVCSNCPHFPAFCSISTKGHIKPGVCNRENALWINECKMGFVRLLAPQITPTCPEKAQKLWEIKINKYGPWNTMPRNPQTVYLYFLHWVEYLQNWWQSEW